MAVLIFACLVTSALSAGAGYLVCRKSWGARIQALEGELAQLSEAICQMAEMQTSAHQRVSGTLGDLEERLLDLAIPAQDSNLPLEKRHQVLALARKGMGLDDIVKRLKVPRGEAELILSLRRYLDVPIPQTRKPHGAALNHVEA